MTHNSKSTALINEIFKVTATIQKEFPELYKLLNETPLYRLSNDHTGVPDFETYLKSLKAQLEAFRNAYPDPKNRSY